MALKSVVAASVAVPQSSAAAQKKFDPQDTEKDSCAERAPWSRADGLPSRRVWGGSCAENAGSLPREACAQKDERIEGEEELAQECGERRRVRETAGHENARLIPREIVAEEDAKVEGGKRRGTGRGRGEKRGQDVDGSRVCGKEIFEAKEEGEEGEEGKWAESEEVDFVAMSKPGADHTQLDR